MTANNPYALNVASKYSTHSVILSQIGTGNCVLDVGCNEGYLGRLADKSNTFYGLEFVPERVELAKAHYKAAIQYDLNQLKNLPWDVKFDVIILADVLEHVLYPEKALSFFVKHYLRPGGKIILSLPNVANWQVRFGLLLGKFDYAEAGILDRTHLHLYTFKTAQTLSRQGGCQVKSLLYGASFFGRVIKLLPFLRNLLTTSIIVIGQAGI